MPPHLADNLRRLARELTFAVAFTVLYVVLDWVSFIRPLQHLNLTPWNPAPALGLLLLIRHGLRAMPLVFVAIVASDVLVRSTLDSPGRMLLLSALLTAGYAFMAMLLRRRFPEGGLFHDRRSLFIWSLIVIGGTLGNGLLYVAALMASGLLAPADLGDGLLRFWIGDGVGIFVSLPLFRYLQDGPRRDLIVAVTGRWDTIAYLGLAGISLWIAFIPGANGQFRYFYVLFLPVVWAASRQGLAGAVFCASMLQMGMMFAGQWVGSLEISLLEVQIRAFLLALVGFLIGVAVDEQRRAVAELRQSLRLVAAGEMAGALAHELNQPLTALSAYGAACERLLEQGNEQQARLRETIRRMVAEAGRAAEVVRRLRDFFRTGDTRLETVMLTGVVEAAVAPFRGKAAATDVDFVCGNIPDVIVHVDRLQIEVVLRNLLANAFDAVSAGGGPKRQVCVSAAVMAGERVAITVQDSGPGLSADAVEQIFEPFATTKSSGLGLGLAISRSIVQAHGGTLVAEAGNRGSFCLVLPLADASLAEDGVLSLSPPVV